MFKMKTKILLLAILSMTCLSLLAQTNEEKREKRKNLTIKEWNTNAATQTRFLDHITKYNAQGFKTEEIEYANYGQKSKITYEYDASGKCVKEVEYDGRNKVLRIRKFEYYTDGSKKKQYNYLPSGKLESSKEFEYIFAN